MKTFVTSNGILTLRGRKEGGGEPAGCIWLKQVHGTQVQYEPPYSGLEGDAIIGRYGSGTYAIKLVDCLGICILGSKHFALIHAGRKGLYSGVIHATVENLYRHGEQDIDIQVYLSPCIKKLEVGRDGSNFTRIVPEAFLVNQKGSIGTIDIIGRASSQLQYHGIRTIIDHPDDTMQNNDRWYSNRIEGTSKRNRMVFES